ncbi:MAG: cyclopropane-fatty-acyl-phospholipid synthase family protein [Gammaproteobacteria bacterium]|nr:cyclopropane-fatty-acyl-phospholipid synthase family protein [Gammaproteobacteria bacterium]
MSINAQRGINWVEQGYVPDTIVRKGIRRLLKQRLLEINADDAEVSTQYKYLFIEAMKQSPIALSPEKANEQHYEVPAEFYDLVLGEHNKYSCCYWDETTKDLTQAEDKALQITCNHADLENGQSILELGCGWGSLTLWMAQYYPLSQITAVSNSHSQKEFILKKADALGLKNIQVITCDMNDFNTIEKFDRVVSVEMFEHMRNWEQLYKQVSTWLKDDGKFFKHVFSHRQVPYSFEVKDSSDWMSEYFFTGGMMPCDDLPLHFQQHLNINKSWTWSGEHYEKTSNAWLERMDKNKQVLKPVFKKAYGDDQANLWWVRWRLFFMACAELFAYDNGQQWHVTHYLFNKA